MSYRTIEIHWMPQTASEWRTFTAARTEAARLWGDLVERHHRVRRQRWQWPSKQRWQQWAKGRYPGLSAQSVQQIIGEFCEAVHSTRQLRRNGHDEARYPWKKPRYRDVVYTNQDARLRHGRLILPHGTSGRLRIPVPMALPGRLMEVRLSMAVVRLVCDVPEVPTPQQAVIGVDLGVNTLLAATDGTRAILISGRVAKATVQYRNKRLASCSQAQSTKTKGSRQWKRLQRRKAKMLAKTHVDEHFTSQTCPVCGVRNKNGRRHRCRSCGQTAPRDVIGSVNILHVGCHTVLVPGRSVPNAVEWVHPVKYPGPKPGSS